MLVLQYRRNCFDGERNSSSCVSSLSVKLSAHALFLLLLVSLKVREIVFVTGELALRRPTDKAATARHVNLPTFAL